MLWGLRPVQTQAAYNLAVDKLRRQIHLGLLLPNERLPSERALAEEINIARVTLREALRVLEGNKYIVIKRGQHGGAFVEKLEVLDQVAMFRISSDRAGMMRILEFREANEQAAIRLATTRATLPELKRMRAALGQMRDAREPASLKQAETMFTLAMADAAHNPLISHAVEDGLDQMFLPYFVAEFDHWRSVSTNLYSKLLGAIEAQNADQAAAVVGEILARDWVRVKAITV
ncbi:GntR family transcriptional regulator (plasmid) [Rhizobium sp. CB3090]|uniref:FadR/GntR family transcriptional regulator n=1 Tax=Rhizobium sp. CB3090 TaxID=3039156 RepID=UPI0024B06D2A|nr:FCD domain-containing protein [Rhizobium sp. CB3090]WFU11764.1 GntR family transcriptional regulator [Rhizobium sp. CB3090]